MTLYIGPGVGIATIIIVAIVLLIVTASLFLIMYGMLKNMWRKMKKFFLNQ